MKKLCTFLFLAIAMTMSAQDFTFKNASDLFSNALPFDEVKSIEHSVNSAGKGVVTVEVVNGAVYSSTVDNIEINTVQREEILETGKFADMTMVASNKNIRNHELGDLIGIFNEEDYTISEFMQKAYAVFVKFGLYDSITELLGYYTKAFAATNLVSAEDIRIHIADVVYVGVDFNGKKIPLSARFIYPYNQKNGNLRLAGYYLDNHVTVFEKDTEPTTKLSEYSPCGSCAKGYFVIQPDLVGFGASNDHTQMYVDADLNGSAVAYSVVAAQQYANYVAGTGKYAYRMPTSAGITNTGASQGASTALSATYYIENKIDKTKFTSFPSLYQTRICAGAYNLKLCMDEFCKAGTITYSSKIPMLMAGAITANTNTIAPYTIHDYFNPLIQQYSYTTRKGVKKGTVWQMLDLKNTSSTTIDAILIACFPSDENKSFPSLKKLLADDLITTSASGNVLNWKNPKLAALNTIFEKNNFASRSMWTPKSSIVMCHADNDDIIPYSTSQEFYDNHNSSLISLTKVEDVPTLDYLGSYAVHMITVFEWIISELTGLPITTVNDQLKEQLNK